MTLDSKLPKSLGCDRFEDYILVYEMNGATRKARVSMCERESGKEVVSLHVSYSTEIPVRKEMVHDLNNCLGACLKKWCR